MGLQLYYTSAKFIRVQNTPLAVVYYLAQLALFAYVIVYQIWWKGGYLKISAFEGSIDVNVRGAGYLGDYSACPNGADWPNCGPYDAFDVTLPPQQQGGVFIGTSFYTTRNQKRGVCNSPSSDFQCDSSNKCPSGMVGLGTTDATYLTGECNTTAKPPVCLAVAWCPPEEPSSAIAKDMHVLEDVANFTVFFRVDGRFEGIDEFESSQITTLAFNENTFFLRDILTYSQSSTQMRRTVTPNVTVALDDATNITAFDTVKETGTVVFLTATMMKRESDITDPKPCEFSPGANITELCKIYLQFNRVDPKGKSLSKGANYRFTTPAGVVTTGERDLTKLFGTRIVFTVGGTGAQFDLITLTVSVGSGIGILSVAKVVCDLILQYLCGAYHPKYKTSKYENVTETPGYGLDSDDEEVLTLGNPTDGDKSLVDPETQGHRVVVNAANIQDDEDEEQVGCWKMFLVRCCC